MCSVTLALLECVVTYAYRAEAPEQNGLLFIGDCRSSQIIRYSFFMTDIGLISIWDRDTATANFGSQPNFLPRVKADDKRRIKVPYKQPVTL